MGGFNNAEIHLDLVSYGSRWLTKWLGKKAVVVETRVLLRMVTVGRTVLYTVTALPGMMIGSLNGYG